MSMKSKMLVALASSALAGQALAVVTIYHNATPGVANQNAQEAAFQANSGALTMIDFEDQANGAVLVGNEYAGLGALFSQPAGFGIHLLTYPSINFQPRSLVNALFPTGGVDVGDPDREKLQLDLTTAQQAVGLWLIDPEFESPTAESIEFLAADLSVIASIPMPHLNALTGDTPDGNFFVGVISDTPIARVVMNEYIEATAPQRENVGWDDIQFGVPEPSSLLLLALPAVGLLRRR